MPTTKQAQLDAILKKTAEKYDGFNDNLQDYAIREIERTRLSLIDLLHGYAIDDIIQIKRIQSLFRDLDNIEKSIYENGMTAMNGVIKRSADVGIRWSSLALGTVVGATAEIGEEFFSRISAVVLRYVVNRFGEDGLVLSDRVWQFSRGQRAELEQVIRNGIIRGESVNTLVSKVRKVYANETWKIRRLVITEGNVAYRTAGAYVAQQSPYVQALKIHRGEADRPEHRCSQMEKIDRYGLGDGIYIPTDTEVLHPHVNCTAYTTYVVTDGKGDGK